MTNQSATRRALEEKIRAVVPARKTGTDAASDPQADAAAAGVGGLLVGYVWGWWRGRRGARASARLAARSKKGRA